MEIVREVFIGRMRKELGVESLNQLQRNDIIASYGDDASAAHLLHGKIEGKSIYDDIVTRIYTIREQEKYNLSRLNTIAPLWEWEEGQGGRVDTFDYAFLRRFLREATRMYMSKVMADKQQITISNVFARELFIITLLIFFQKNPGEDSTNTIAAETHINRSIFRLAKIDGEEMMGVAREAYTASSRKRPRTSPPPAKKAKREAGAGAGAGAVDKKREAGDGGSQHGPAF